MKRITAALIVMATIIFNVDLNAMAQVFHKGGVAYCDGCHSIHNSADNPISGAGPSPALLKGDDSSSTCLNCHAGSGSYHIASDDGTNVNQGGDFFWVKTDYTYPGNAGPETSFGKEHGHNIIASNFPAFIADDRPENAVAPGGSYSAALLGCTSCHDAHGQVLGGTRGGIGPVSASGSYGNPIPTDGSVLGNYRLLGDSAYTAGGPTDGYPFSFDAPVARAEDINGSSFSARVDYGSGMSEWCANCHSAYLGGGTGTDKHANGNSATLGTYAGIYNNYIATGNWVAGGTNKANAYDSLVPFERGETDGYLLDPTSKVGPEIDDNVACITCHRSHASANKNIARWDFTEEYLADSKALEAITSGGLVATAIPYYKDGTAVDVTTEYGQYQRSLCNKCHAQD